jgi:ribosome recycling factor
MHPTIEAAKPDYELAMEYLQKELAGLRTGRATPMLVENIAVNAYGSQMEVRGLGSISTPDAKTIVIDPWDKSLLQSIEKGIRAAGIGLNPVVDGTILRIVMPQMTEENRKQMVKVMKEKIEESRVKVRHVREEVRDTVVKLEKEKAISEDEKFKVFDELDKITKTYNDRISEVGEAKEDEIMTI